MKIGILHGIVSSTALSTFFSFFFSKNDKEKAILAQISTLPNLSLNPKNAKPQKNVANLIGRAPQHVRGVVWYSMISKIFARHRKSNYRAYSIEGSIGIFKKKTFFFCQRSGILEKIIWSAVELWSCDSTSHAVFEMEK